jgi:hypothetical protein
MSIVGLGDAKSMRELKVHILGAQVARHVE